MKKYNSVIKKALSLITMVAFIFSTMSFDLALALEKDTSGAAIDIRSINIPRNLGKVQDSWQAEEGAPVVIHIQDAHADYGAQHKISEIINYLNKEYGFRVVNLEGGEGGYDLHLFNRISDLNHRKEVTDYFVDIGRLSGAEYFAANNTGAVKLWGVENADLYLANLEAYTSFLPKKRDGR